jgi:hypothetical protein
MKKRKTTYHTLTTPQGNAAKKVTAPQALRRQIEEVLMDMEANRHSVSLRLISLQDDSFIYEETWEGATRKYKVNLVTWESGQKVPDFSSQELITDDQVNNVLSNAVQTYANNFTKGEKNMNTVQPLMIPDIETYKTETKKEEEDKIRKLQEEADRRNILLPAELNAKPTSKPKNKQEWDQSKGIEPLIPIVS